MRSEFLRTVEVPLTQGLVALISEEDIPLIEGYKWHAVKCSGNFYAGRSLSRSKGGRRVYMHRQILGLSSGRAIVVDHLNGDTLNNTRTNIVATTQSANLQNSRRYREKASRYRGVFSVANGWTARIRCDNKSFYLGFFRSEELAAAAYDGAAAVLYGPKARMNLAVGHETNS